MTNINIMLIAIGLIALLVLYVLIRKSYIYNNKLLYLGIKAINYEGLNIKMVSYILFWAYFNYPKYKVFCSNIFRLIENRGLSYFDFLVREAFSVAKYDLCNERGKYGKW